MILYGMILDMRNVLRGVRSLLRGMRNVLRDFATITRDFIGTVFAACQWRGGYDPR